MLLHIQFSKSPTYKQVPFQELVRKSNIDQRLQTMAVSADMCMCVLGGIPLSEYNSTAEGDCVGTAICQVFACSLLG